MGTQRIVIGQDGQQRHLRELQYQIVKDVQGGLPANLLVHQDQLRLGGAQITGEFIKVGDHVYQNEFTLAAEGSGYLLLDGTRVAKQSHPSGVS